MRRRNKHYLLTSSVYTSYNQEIVRIINATRETSWYFFNMRKEDLPYAYEGYAENYDKVYLDNPITLKHAQFELELVEKILNKPNYISWCDAACGTGWHIRNSGIASSVVGIDREKRMLEYAKSQCDNISVQWIENDIKTISQNIGCFDLVTHFWLGYIHQETLDDVQAVVEGLAEAVNSDGTLCITICDPASYFDNIRFNIPIVFEHDLYVDAIIRRYNDPITNTEYKNCIAPHPKLMLQWLEPYFETISIIDYPKGDGSPKWRRKAFLCEGKINGAPEEN